MPVLDIHSGKRQVLMDESMELIDGRFIFFALMMATDPKYNHCIHIQKCILKDGELEPQRGGIMIDTEYLRQLKVAVDQAYNTAVEYGLL